MFVLKLSGTQKTKQLYFQKKVYEITFHTCDLFNTHIQSASFSQFDKVIDTFYFSSEDEDYAPPVARKKPPTKKPPAARSKKNKVPTFILI